MEIREALGRMDPADDSQWTADGLPRVDVVNELCGEAHNRVDVTNAAPTFTRETLIELHRQRASEQPEEVEEVVDEVEEEEQGEEEELPPVIEPAVDEGPLPTDLPSLDEVMKMQRADVLASYPLTIRCKEAVSERINDKLREKSAIENELKQLNAKVQLLSRAEAAHLRNNPRLAKMDPVKAYLESTKKARAERAYRAKRYVEAGTTRDDVVKQLDGRSGLDKALNATGKGRGRPQARKPRSLA